MAADHTGMLPEGPPHGWFEALPDEVTELPAHSPLHYVSDKPIVETVADLHHVYAAACLRADPDATPGETILYQLVQDLFDGYDSEVEHSLLYRLDSSSPGWRERLARRRADDHELVALLEMQPAHWSNQQRSKVVREAAYLSFCADSNTIAGCTLMLSDDALRVHLGWLLRLIVAQDVVDGSRRN